MLSKEQKGLINSGEWNIDFDCGCEAECDASRGFPVWTLLSLCTEHDPTIDTTTEEKTATKLTNSLTERFIGKKKDE